MTNLQIARRTLLTRTASGVGTLFGVGFGFGLTPATAQTAAFQFPMAPAIRKDEFWANKGNVKLALYRKRFAKPDGDKSLPVFFLVHGSSLSALSSFDLSVAGSEYSMMNVFARSGFDVWTITGAPHRRQAIPTLPAGSRIGPRRSMWFSAKPAVPRFTCSASPPAPYAPALSRNRRPDRVERLILTAFTYKGEGAAEIARRRARIEELRANPKRKRDAAMIRSIFSRDGHPNL